MKATTKKSLIALSIVLILLPGTLLLLPYVFKDKVNGLVRVQAEKFLNAKLDFSELSLNVFSDFPNITAALGDFTLIGVDSFATDTLVSARKVRMSIDLKTLMTDNGFQLRKIELDKPRVLVKWLATGEANFDIMKPDTSVVEDSTDTDTTAIHFKIQEISLKDARLVYDDRKHGLYAAIDDWTGVLTGDLSSDVTTISTRSLMESLTFRMASFDFPFLDKARLEADLTFKTDLKNDVYTFETNSILLNAMDIAFDGSIALPGEDILFDLKANTEKVGFKQLLSLVPAFYQKDFEDLKADGKLQLDFFMKGLMTETDWPSFGFNLLIQHAMIQYPSLPKAVRDIQMACSIANPGGSLDQTKVDLSRFHFNLGGNPFDVTAKVVTPQSDPGFSGSLAGKINLGMVKEVYPLPEDVRLQGIVVANLKAGGRMSYLDRKQYEKFTADGTLSVSDFLLKTKDQPDIHLKTASMKLTPKVLTLSDLSVLIGKNDLQATGSLQNFLGWYLRDDVLSGSLNVTSGFLNLNDFMTGSSDESKPAATEKTPDTSSMKAIAIPKNLNLSLNATGRKILFNKLTLENATAALTVKDAGVSIRNLSAQALGGSIGVTGRYETVHPEKPEVAFGLNLKDVSFAKTIAAFDFMQKLAPIFAKIQGNYSMKMDFNTVMDAYLNPDLKVLNGDGKLQSKGVKVSGVKVLDVLATTLKKEQLRTIAPKDLDIPFTISDGKVTTKPFDVKLGDLNLRLGGVTGLDQSIDYTLKMQLPEKWAVGGVRQLDGSITGSFEKPVVKLGLAAAAQQAALSAADNVLQKTLGTNTQETLAKAKAELNKKAEALRTAAKTAGDKLIEQAVAEGDKLIAKASNPVLKAAAKATAAQLKKEAEKKAASLMADAERKISQMAADAAATTN